MKKIIWLDMRNILNSIEYKMVVTIYLAINLYAFILCIKNDVGSHYQFIRSADENFILQGTESYFLLYIMVMFFPILSAVMCSFQKKSDDLENRSILTIQRCGRKKYLLSKIGAISFMTFIGTVIPLFLNLVLCHMIYPQIGYDSEWAEPKFMIGMNSYSADKFIDMFRLEHSTVYNISYIFVYGIMAIGIALLAFGIAMKEKKKAHVMVKVPFLIFFLYEIFNILLQMIGLYKIIPMNYLIPGYTGSIVSFLCMIAFLLAVDVFLIRKGVCKYEIL